MDTDGLEELLCRHDGQAFQVALRMLNGCYDDASDAVQEARIACWQYLDSYDESKGDFGFWYIAVVRNCCQRLHKQRARSSAWMTVDGVGEIIASPLDQLIDREDRSYLHGAIDALPGPQAKAVRMRYLAGCEYPDIAQELGVAESTVRSAVSLGLKNLKERLGVVGIIGA